MLNLPLPLPILDPITFFVSGMCGKVLTQTRLEVLSVFLDDFFKNIFNLNIFLLLIKKGFVITSPECPKHKLLLMRAFILTPLCLCRNLNLNFLGCNTKKTRIVNNSKRKILQRKFQRI